MAAPALSTPCQVWGILPGRAIMHPGAGLTGADRTTAMRMLQDLDIDFGQAIGVEQPVAVAREER
jgi:hypothetical protein